MSHKVTFWTNLLKKIWLAFAITIICGAVFSSIFRSLTPWAEQYKQDVETKLTELLGQPITIQNMQTGWYWWHPVLKLGQVRLTDGPKVLQIKEVMVGINLWKSAFHRRIEPSIFYIDDVHIKIRQRADGWEIEGLALKSTHPKSSAQTQQQLLSWLAERDRLVVKHVSADIYLNKQYIPITDFNLSIVNSNGNYKLKGRAQLTKAEDTLIEILGDLSFDPEALNKTHGQLYIALSNIYPKYWQNLLPKNPINWQSGKGDIALWLDLDKGWFSAGQGQIHLKDLSWYQDLQKNKQFIPSFYANLDWKTNSKGWVFEADHIQLKMKDRQWPENQIRISFDKQQNIWSLFTKTFIIDSLLTQTIPWPDQLNSLLALHPKGTLNQTQAVIKNNQLSYLLTEFKDIAWQGGKKLPSVDNLSGVIHWQPEEGQLELDSEQVTLLMPGYPKQKINILNTAIDWKELSNGFKVSVARFVLSQPQLTLSFEGVVDELSKNSIGHINLDLQFAAKEAQKWIPYLPKKIIKPKLWLWLNQDLKRVADLTGRVKLNGLAKDFPFDNQQGEFSIQGHAVGGELFITSKWQLSTELEGFIHFKNRNLDIDLVHGNFQGVPLKQMNLVINDIGKDKETLLIHGVIEGRAQKMLNFIMASPLKESLQKLSMLTLKGWLGVDLNLEIPLYPENNDNLVRGVASFHDNQVVLTQNGISLPIEHLKGDLAFNEHGASNSILEGSAFDYPLHIKIRSASVPKPITTILIEGECAVDSLANHIKGPIISLFKGIFPFKALLKLTPDPNDFDNITFSSNLKGLAIHLPKPLGKSSKEDAALRAILDFNSQKNLNLKLDYRKRMSADLSFNQDKGALKLHSGQIDLNNTHAVNQHLPGLAIVGTLDGFDLSEWKELFERFATEQNQGSFLDYLRVVDVRMHELSFLHQNFDDMSIQAKILPHNQWSFNLKQKRISADLNYDTATHALSGLVHYLHLDKIHVDDKQSASHIHPGEIPNLNLRVDDLSVGALQVGSLTLKSHSTAQLWHIDYCKINTPIYESLIDGGWSQNGERNQTQLKVRLHLKDLAKSLERWDITPAVDASMGDLQFEGGWNSSLAHFSLASLHGEMYLELKNGRITHLSPETEEKLGLGKLLSVLSLQTIPRRLKLDFSDLSQEGYSFDVFKGHFKVAKGIMNTEDSYIDGPVAYASMKGNLDLARQLYDLDLNISPHITASLPVVATIAGGPIAGIAAWVANKIINQSMQKITAYSYKISGPWKQPVVQQLSIVKKVSKQ